MSNITILLFTANDANDVLNSLSEEGKSIQRSLNSTSGRSFETVLVPDATTTDIIKELMVPDRVVEIIHYAGHADTSSLRFTDQDTDAVALAAKIKSQGTIKLVFLNGCATHTQVKYFHEAGVPFVLATSRPVKDSKATWMAMQFYQYLILKRSLTKAMAEVVIDSQQLTKQIAFSNERGIRVAKTDAETATFEWGLYVHPDFETADYSLPVTASSGVEVSEIVHSRFLDKLIFGLDTKGNPGLSAIKKMAANMQRGYKVTDRKKTVELLKVFPYTLGIRLRQIVAEPDNRSTDYYRQLLFDYVFFFETTLHHAVTFLLARLWQDGAKALEHQPESIAIIKTFIQENRMVAPYDSYPPLITLLVQWLNTYLEEDEIAIGTKPLAYFKADSFKEAAKFFYLQKQYYWQKVRLSEAEAIENCFIAQKYINEAFPYFDFILKYTLASVRGVKVMNFRHLPADFENIENIVSKLIVNEIEPVPIAGNLDLENMMENKTVLSFFGTELELGNESMSLFPFIIDRNVFADTPNTEVDLYLFVGYFKYTLDQAPCYHFSSVNNPSKIWQFDPEEPSDVDFLHIGEETTLVHKHNHLMASASAWEFNNYLDQYRSFLDKIE